jgi:hypothetical protein
MLRINEVALRANGELQFCCTLTQKSLIFKGFRVLRGKKHYPFTIAPYLESYGLEPATLWIYLEKMVIL